MQLLQLPAHASSPKDFNDRTPLSWAAENGHLEIVKLLLKEGVGVDSEDAWTPWSWAKQIVRTPLSWAAENGHLEVVKLLLKKGADVASKENDGQTPMSRAAGNGHLEIVKLLLEERGVVRRRCRGPWRCGISNSSSCCSRRRASM